MDHSGDTERGGGRERERERERTRRGMGFGAIEAANRRHTMEYTFVNFVTQRGTHPRDKDTKYIYK